MKIQVVLTMVPQIILKMAITKMVEFDISHKYMGCYGHNCNFIMFPIELHGFFDGFVSFEISLEPCDFLLYFFFILMF
jgi:hypothetical protein